MKITLMTSFSLYETEMCATAPVLKQNAMICKSYKIIFYSEQKIESKCLNWKNVQF